MNAPLNISFIQCPLIWEDAAKNRHYFQDKISQIQEADLILLPEMFNTGFSMNSKMLAEKMDGQSIAWLREMANKSGAVICGSIIVQEGGQYFNRLIWMRPDGSHEKYDKRHLFRMANEDQYFSAGKERLIVELNNWKICPQICYDLRFPVWSRNRFESDRKSYVHAEYDILLFIANWPQARVSAWSSLLRARAIENQCFVVGLNRTGEDGNGIAYNGMSAIIDAKGETIIEAGNKKEMIASSKLEFSELESFREKFPVGMDADNFDLKK